jgi:hypothetical protein
MCFVTTCKSSHAYINILVAKPKRKRPLWRHKRRWEDNIKMNLEEIIYKGLDRNNTAQYGDQWRVMDLQVS